MATKSISQLDSASTMALGDLLEIAEPNAQSVSGYTSKKISIGSQLAPYIQGTVQNASLNTTDKTLVGAINEVKSELPTNPVLWSENNLLGAKNLLNISGAERNYLGVNSTLNQDGSVTVNGTATGQGQMFVYNYCEFPKLNLGDKIIFSFEVLSGSYTHGSSSSLTRIYLVGLDNNTLQNKACEMGASLSVGDKVFVTYEIDSHCFENGICKINGVQGYFRSGDVFSNLKLGIMVRLESVADDTFEPFAQTNRQLTLEKAEMTEIAPIENGDTASQAYAIGDYMFFKGGFYKVTSAISSGGAITLNTNVTKTTIGAELKAALNS